MENVQGFAKATDNYALVSEKKPEKRRQQIAQLAQHYLASKQPEAPPQEASSSFQRFTGWLWGKSKEEKIPKLTDKLLGKIERYLAFAFEQPLSPPERMQLLQESYAVRHLFLQEGHSLAKIRVEGGIGSCLHEHTLSHLSLPASDDPAQWLSLQNLTPLENYQRVSGYGSTYPNPAGAEIAILDSSYFAQVNQGWVLAVADGCGHPPDPTSLKNIARAAKCAAKYSARLLSTYSSPEVLKEELLPIIQEVDRKLIQKIRGEEQTTVTALRGFYTQDTLRLIGFTVGDTSALVLDPVNKKCEQLSKMGRLHGAVYMLGRPKGGDCGKDQVLLIDTTVSAKSQVFAFSDGVTDLFPSKVTGPEEQESDWIDPDFLSRLLLQEPYSLEAAFRRIETEVKNRAQTRRKEIPELKAQFEALAQELQKASPEPSPELEQKKNELMDIRQKIRGAYEGLDDVLIEAVSRK